MNRIAAPALGLVVGLSAFASFSAEAARPAKRASAVKRAPAQKTSARPRLIPARADETYRPSVPRAAVLPDARAQSASTLEMEDGALYRLNQERQRRGLAPLRVNETLSRIAREFSRRRSSASATTPPISAKVTSGITRASPIAPRAYADSVRV